MTKPDSQFFAFDHKGKSYRIHYLDWGKTESPVVICAHGLTRNTHDFDYLASAICDQFRVIAIDFPGRGSSDWLEDKNDYVIPTYLQVVSTLLQELSIRSFNWLGTSMGGLIGMILAAQNPQSFQRLIINDVGPEVPSAAANRIIDYLSKSEKFSNLEDFEQHVRQVYAPFGQLTDEQWRHLAKYSYQTDGDGKITSNYDPGIVVPFKTASNAKADLWPLFQSIKAPIYLIHGENSDILLPSILKKMKQLQPNLTSTMIKAVGHAPALMDKDQINIISNWLNN